MNYVSKTNYKRKNISIEDVVVDLFEFTDDSRDLHDPIFLKDTFRKVAKELRGDNTFRVVWIHTDHEIGIMTLRHFYDLIPVL